MREYPSETADGLGFAPIGLDEPYRIIVGNNPTNKRDPKGLYYQDGFPGGEIHGGPTVNELDSEWAKFIQGLSIGGIKILCEISCHFAGEKGVSKLIHLLGISGRAANVLEEVGPICGCSSLCDKLADYLTDKAYEGNIKSLQSN